MSVPQLSSAQRAKTLESVQCNGSPLNGTITQYSNCAQRVHHSEFPVMLLEPRPFRPFKSSEEYLYAMKEDLAEWLNTLYGLNITADNFMSKLETGVTLCK